MNLAKLSIVFSEFSSNEGFSTTEQLSNMNKSLSHLGKLSILTNPVDNQQWRVNHIRADQRDNSVCLSMEKKLWTEYQRLVE